MARPVMSRAQRAEFIKQSRDIVIPFFDAPKGDEAEIGHAKYTALTRRQYRAFMDSYRGEGAEDTKISFGFRVVGNLLGHVPVAYANFLNDNREIDNRCELKDTLLRRFEAVVGSIASLDRDRATRYETWLGLRDGIDPLGSNCPYRFLRWQGELTFEPKMDNLDEIDEEVSHYTRSEEQTPQPERGCPALKFVLPELWGINVTGCLEDPDYFFDDIQKLRRKSPEQASV